MWALTLPRMVARAWVEQCIDPDDAGLWILELCNTRKRARQPGRVVPRRPPRAGERKTGWICAEVAGPWPLAIAGLLGRARRNADALLNVLRDYAVGILTAPVNETGRKELGLDRNEPRPSMLALGTPDGLTGQASSASINWGCPTSLRTGRQFLPVRLEESRWRVTPRFATGQCARCSRRVIFA
jgi:hypothetical protein